MVSLNVHILIQYHLCVNIYQLSKTLSSLLYQFSVKRLTGVDSYV